MRQVVLIAVCYAHIRAPLGIGTVVGRLVAAMRFCKTKGIPTVLSKKEKGQSRQFVVRQTSAHMERNLVQWTTVLSPVSSY